MPADGSHDHTRLQGKRESPIVALSFQQRAPVIAQSCVLGADDNSCFDGCNRARGREGGSNRLRKTTVVVYTLD